MSKQLTLNEYNLSSNGLLNQEQALSYAFNFLRIAPLGSQFTCYKIFSGVKTRFDRRKLGSVMLKLRSGGFIDRISYVPEERETGNPGISALYEKIKEVA